MGRGTSHTTGSPRPAACPARVPDSVGARSAPPPFALSLTACPFLAGAKSLTPLAECAADAPPAILSRLSGPCREPDRGPVTPATARRTSPLPHPRRQPPAHHPRHRAITNRRTAAGLYAESSVWLAVAAAPGAPPTALTPNSHRRVGGRPQRPLLGVGGSVRQPLLNVELITSTTCISGRTPQLMPVEWRRGDL